MKKIRATKAYKEMTPYMAVGIAEGFEEGTAEEELAAWQYIWDKGIWKGLQGWFGRTVHQLVEDGIIKK